MIKSISDKFLEKTAPYCKVCNKQVDSFELFNDFMTDELVFVASCHDKKDYMKINKYDFNDIDWKILDKGFAFDKKYIDSNKYLLEDL
jgi:hypothetical protein